MYSIGHYNLVRRPVSSGFNFLFDVMQLETRSLRSTDVVFFPIAQFIHFLGGAVGDINGPEDFASSARLRRLQRMRQRIYDQQNMERLQDLAFNPSVRSQSLSAVEIV